MDSKDLQKIKLDACYLQLGTRGTARRIRTFDRCFSLLRFLLPLVTLLNYQRLLGDNTGRILFVAALLMLPATAFVSACKTLLKNRWFYCCRAKKRRRFSSLFSSFSRSDVLLALRLRAFSFRHKTVRVLLFMLTPAMLLAFSAVLTRAGVSSRAFFVLAAGTFIAAAVSAVFAAISTRSVNAVASLCRTHEDARNMKSSLHRLDESCFEMFLYNCSLASLGCGCREQAKMLYALEIINQERSAWQAFRYSIHA